MVSSLLRIGCAALGAMLVMTSVAFAIELEQVADVNIHDARVVTHGDATYDVVFEVTNSSITPLQNIQYGVRLQSTEGDIVYAYSSEANTTTIGGAATQEVATAFTLPSALAPDTYDVIATLYNRSGSLLANAIVGDIEVKGSSVDATLACEITEEGLAYACTYSPIDRAPTYTITRGGIFGDTQEEGVLRVTGDGEAVVDLALLEGRVGVMVSLEGEEGDVLAQSQMVYESPSNWIAVSGLVERGIVDGVFSADIFLEGKGETSMRGFVYALVNVDGNVCASGDQRFDFVVPRKRTITLEVPAECTGATFAGFLYDGMRPNGTFNVVDSFGTVPPELLIGQGARPQNTIGGKILDLVYSYPLWVYVLGLFALVVLGALVRSMHSEGWKTITKRSLIFVAITAGGMYAGTTPVHAATFYTADNPNTAAFTVNLDNAGVFSDQEEVSFTFTIEPRQSGVTAKVRVDDGSDVTIVAPSENKVSYAVSLDPVTEGGAHTLNFTVLDMCGSAFGYSTFSTARFGSEDCTFSVDFEVTTNTAPGLPQMRGSCTVGANNTYEFSSVDNDQVYYQVRFNGTGPTLRTPSSGYVNPYSTYSGITYDGWDTQGSKVIKARAIDTYNARSGWKTFAVQCTPVCAASVVCDDSGPNADFYALPALVPTGSVTTLHWEPANVHNCSIDGTNGDAWGWDVLSTVNEVETSVISEATTYTLACDDFDGESHSWETTVRLAPVWQEF